jgi:hypothetical protein
MKTKKLIPLIIVAVGVIGWLWIRSTSVEESEADNAQGSNSVSNEPRVAVKRSVPAVEIPENVENVEPMRSISKQLVELALDRKRLFRDMKLARTDPQMRLKKLELKGQFRELESDLAELLKNSRAAQKEFVEIVHRETDPMVKRELVTAVRSLSPEFREEMGSKLAKDDDGESRKLGLHTLSLSGTSFALSEISDAAQKEREPAVQIAAIHALSQFTSLNAEQAEPNQAVRNQTLRTLSDTHNSLEVREAAFRGLISQAFLSPQDKEFVAEFARTETDPKLKKIAESAQRVISARR